METQNTQAGEAWRIAQRVAVTESYRVTIQCKYYGPTNHRGSRIVVTQLDGGRSVDPHRLTVKWDDSCNTGENYANAVRRYCEGAEWLGHWRIGSTPTGAVAVWVGYVDEVEVSV